MFVCTLRLAQYAHLKASSFAILPPERLTEGNGTLVHLWVAKHVSWHMWPVSVIWVTVAGMMLFTTGPPVSHGDGDFLKVGRLFKNKDIQHIWV